MDTIDQNTAFELSREFYVAQPNLFATLLFRPTAAGSAVTVRMENFETSQDRDSNRQAWEGALTTLQAILGTHGNLPGRSLCRD